MSTFTGRTVAVVIGAGVAGLATARVLSDRYERVIVLDRDQLPDAAVPRRGVSQSHHPHVLLAAGLRALEELFPGLEQELVAAGATPFDSGLGLRLYRFGKLWPAVPTGMRVVSLSRPLLELALRRRVCALANVTVREGVAVDGLVPVTAAGAVGAAGGDRESRGGTWVAGPTGTVAGRVGGVALDGADVLPADLVVDCSGRGSRCDHWLAGLGFPVPETVEVQVGVGYATRLLHRNPDDFPDGEAILVLPSGPESKRVGLALPIEDKRWIVAVGGWHGDFPRGDTGDFRRHAGELPYPALAELIARCEPRSDILVHRFPSSRRRYFERLRRHPAGYLVLGDAVCSVNPIYGQGMTCAVLSAQALGRTLDRHPGASAQTAASFYRAVAEVIATPWRFAVGGDFAFPDTTGPRPLGIRVRGGYSRRVQLAATLSPDVRRVFTGVQQLVLPPSRLLAPSTVAKVLRLTGLRPDAGRARR